MGKENDYTPDLDSDVELEKNTQEDEVRSEQQQWSNCKRKRAVRKRLISQPTRHSSKIAKDDIPTGVKTARRIEDLNNLSAMEGSSAGGCPGDRRGIETMSGACFGGLIRRRVNEVACGNKSRFWEHFWFGCVCDRLRVMVLGTIVPCIALLLSLECGFPKAGDFILFSKKIQA
jgi:hypothetical protein